MIEDDEAGELKLEGKMRRIKLAARMFLDPSGLPSTLLL